GLLLLVVSVEKIPLKHRILPFFLALYIINIGEGGHRPCIQTFAADQFDDNLAAEKLAKSSFFNWWYLGIVIGATTSILVVIYVQDNIGWGWGFGIPAIVVAVALLVFLVGKSTYRKEVRVGSPLTKVAQVMVAAVRKRRLSEDNDGFEMCVEVGEGGGTATRSLDRTNQFRSTGKTNDWRLCTVNEVEQVKLLLRLVPIWLSCLMFGVVIAQLGTFYTKQASTMIRTIGSHFQIPPASLQVIPGLTILTAVPLYERLFIPTARRFTNHPTGITVLQRIGFGIFFSILTMMVSALVESRRLRIASMDDPKSIVPMSVWWLVPQYVLMGISDMLTIVGLQELFYDQVPDEMRSMGAATYLSVQGVGSFMSSAIISIIQKITAKHGDEWLKGDNLNTAHLDYFYRVLACLSTVNLVVYVVLAKGFVYKKLQRNNVNGS
ncbi:hypothetical protein Ccrd_020983, partial [Cynara cardunculus var. scolymus]